MEQVSRPGILERLFIACFRPSRYKELLSVSKLGHVLYFICIVFLLLFIDTIIPFAAWDVHVGGLRTLFTERIPAFTVEKGKMTIEKPLEFDINGIIHFKADSSAERYKKEDLDKEYAEEFLFSSTNLLIKMEDRTLDVSMGDLTKDKLDNQNLVEAIPVFRLFIFIYFFSSYMVKALTYMITVLFFAALCRAAIRTKDGKFVSLKGTIVITIYAKTLFSLIHSVNTCSGTPIGETLILILGTFGTMMYINRAEAAILGISPKKE